MNKKNYIGIFALVILASAGAVTHANAQVANSAMPSFGGGMFQFHKGGEMPGHTGMRPAAFGTVTAVNGATLTVSATNPKDSTVTTYTVDATNAKVTKDRAAGTLASILVGDKVAVVGTVSGTSITATAVNDGVMMGGMGMPRGNGVSGTVSAVSGSTITLTAKQFQRGSTANTASTITYTVDATNAAVTKSGAASSLSAIAIGDRLMVQGTVSGTAVTATKINDGMGEGKGGINSMPNFPTGNGQPVVGGTISAISGTTITITNSSGTAYTADASSAKFSKDGTASATISSLAVGDSVIIQGTVNGSSITAASVIDNGAAPAGANGQAPGSKPAPKHPGFFGQIGGFFKHLFGF